MNIQEKINSIQKTASIVHELNEQQLVLMALGIDQYSFDKIKQLKGKGQKSICSAQIPKDTLFYKCFDCCKETTHVYCQACYKQEKHINHVVTYHYSNGGCCDCGDTLIMKKESFCDQHQANNQTIQNPEQVLGEDICIKYRAFIQVVFSLLYTKIEQIVQYPYNFADNAAKAQEVFSDPEFTQKIEASFPKLMKYQTISKEIQRLYKLIMSILQAITVDNITISLLTSKYLQQPIDKEVQAELMLYHFHCFNTFDLAKIMPQPQVCKCTILELYVKFNGFLCNLIPSDYNEISEIFYELHVDEKFKPYLCRQILKYFNHLYKPIQKYKFITKDNSKFKVTMNQFSYSDDNTVLTLFNAIKQHAQIKKHLCKHDVLQAGLFGYFFQFQGHIVLDLLRLYQENKNNKCYYFFKIFSERMIQIPLCNDKSQTLASRFDDLILSQFSMDVLKHCFEQIEQLLGPENEQFKFILMTPNSQSFNQLQNDSLLIYALTRTYPCTITEAKTFNFLDPDVNMQFINSQIIQIQVLQGYRKLLANVIEAWRQQYNQNKIGLQNMFRLVINYFISNFINSFELHQKEPLKNLLSNQIIGDRNFITLLSIYLANFNESSEAYEDLLSISGDNPFQFKQVMYFLLRRAILSYHVFNSNGNELLYKGQIKLFKEHVKLREVALEQIDVAYLQIYAFIFQEEGINDIIEQYQEIGEVLERPTDPTNMICRICQSDYDYIQCQGDIYGNDLPEQVQKGLTKLFQTIFYAQTFYSSKDLITLLKLFSYDSSVDLQKIILSSCELNKDNDQLQLKKSLLPTQYEPVFCQQIVSLKEKIYDKLKTQNDKFTELFGSSLTRELEQLNNPKSTMTFKRLAIIQSILKDSKQIILEKLIREIQVAEENGKLQNIAVVLENSAIYINLLFQSNKAFGKNKKVLDGLKKIQQISLQIISDVNLTQTINSIFTNYVMLLDEQQILLTQQIEDDARKAQRSNLKKQQYQGKFNKMSQVYNEKILIETPTQIAGAICSICYINFSPDDIQYKAVLLQFTNSHQYNIQVPIQQIQKIDIQQIHATCCGHLFHSKCLKQNKQKYAFGESSFLKCPSCFSPYNFPFMSPTLLTDLKNVELLENLEFFLGTLPRQRVEDYYARFLGEQGIRVPAFIDELFSCALCNLLIQLLGDITQFYQKEHHIFLQEVLMLLRLTYKENQENIFDQLNLNMQQILFKILKAIQKCLLCQFNEFEFKQQLKQLLQQSQNCQAIQELITEKVLKSDVNVHLLPYNINSFKLTLKENYLAYFQVNFRQFLVKYYLSPCEKKKCKFLPLLRIKEQEQQQYICLICWKKMCSQHCGQQTKAVFGNLARHAIKRHMSKSIYLQISNSQILIMVAPLVVLCNLTLFQNLIGEQPDLGYQESSFYEIYKINQKAVDMIVDVISGEKYIHKMFADTQKVLKKKL